MNKRIFSFLATVFIATGAYANDQMNSVISDMTKSHEAYQRRDYSETIRYADKTITGMRSVMAGHPEVRVQGQTVIDKIEEVKEDARALIKLSECKQQLLDQLSEFTKGNVVSPAQG